jgi:hypothetical protein
MRNLNSFLPHWLAAVPTGVNSIKDGASTLSRIPKTLSATGT